jgi:alpha-tubulin suppressor-like RCC1 family protein
MFESSIPSADRAIDHCRAALAPGILLALFLAAFAFCGDAQGAGASAKGWGGNFDGQAGNGEVTQSGCYCIATPTSVVGLTDATQISGGGNHTLALHAGGTVTAWGDNVAGQLGNGTTEDSTAPVQIPGLNNVVSVAAGYEHNLALLADGTVMAWGDNSEGSLGVGSSSLSGGGPDTCGTSTPCSKVPVPVPGLANVIAVAASYYFSFALLADGTVMAWGQDNTGQVGDAGAQAEIGCECVESPVRIPGVSGAMTISAGESHALALLGDGTVVVWGSNQSGQVGDGTAISTPPPKCLCVGPTKANGLPGPAEEASAGNYHNLALLGGGTPQAWGDNFFGQLGNGTTSPPTGCRCVPTPSGVPGLSGVQSVSGGVYHSLALLGDGTARAWGRNLSGQIGDGTEEDRKAPVPVSGVSGASEIVAGEETSFALIGPSHTLSVELAGAGAGVVGGPKGIICPAANCAGSLPDSQVEILRAEAAPGSGFAGFTGPCTGTAPCQVRITADQTVTATFGPPKGTKITKAKIKQGKKAKKGAKGKTKPKARATFAFTTPGVVSGYQCMLVRPRAKRKKGGRRAKRLGAKRKRKPRFVKCSSPRRYKKLKKGRYTFKVRARNALGTEAKPAVRKFKVRR